VLTGIGESLKVDDGFTEVGDGSEASHNYKRFPRWLGEVSSEANQQEHFERALTRERSRRRRDPVYGRRWLTPSLENLA
jgi:hypothetical protein